MSSKICSKCETDKLLSEFHKKTQSKDGYRTICRPCRKPARALQYFNNKSEILIQTAVYRRKNLPLYRQATLFWRSKNPGKVNAARARYAAACLKRTPSWLSKDQLDHIQMFYEAAVSLTKELGIKFHVDHIMPLRGKNSSGLHVPWNLQVITAEENQRKGNR